MRALESYHPLKVEHDGRVCLTETLRRYAEAARPLTLRQKQILFASACVVQSPDDPEKGWSVAMYGFDMLSKPLPCTDEEREELEAVEKCREWGDYFRGVKKYEPLVHESEAKMSRIDAAINSLGDPLEREVLRLRYIDTINSKALPWKLIALRIYGDDDTATVQAVRRLHDAAVAHLEGVEKWDELHA